MMSGSSSDFLEFSRNLGRLAWTEEDVAEQMARSLLVLERQRRIYDRLAQFECELEERAMRVTSQATG
jgi:hypothetical protein